MEKIKTIIGIITILMFFLIAIEPVAISASNQTIEKDPKVTFGDSSAYVGDMKIIGDGDFDDAYVVANAVQFKIVKVDPEGSCVIFLADYYMFCDGFLDGGQVELRVDGADTKIETTAHEKEGTLYTYLDNCKPGRILTWTLVAAYKYNYFYDPIVEHSSGGGWCEQRSRTVTTNPFNQLLNSFMDRIIDIFPILGNLSSRLQNNIFSMKGTIICQ